jgi:hypothetical protein
MISIGIVSENQPYNHNQEPDKYGSVNDAIITSYKQREYYAISKDFNLKQAWNNEWIRENVLKQIHHELSILEYNVYVTTKKIGIGLNEVKKKFTIKDLQYLLNKYGKTNKQIAEEIKEFVGYKEG